MVVFYVWRYNFTRSIRGPFKMKKLALLAALLALSVLPAQARSWKPQGEGAAQDYSVITDMRPNNDMVQVMWLTWPMNAKDSAIMRPLLDRYVILGLSHAQLDSTSGKMAFRRDEDATAADGNGTQLKVLPEANYPPTLAGVVSVFSSFVRQSLGAMGEGMRFVVFESGKVRACDKGGSLSVQYAGETYTYEAPIPGCPAS